jgi:hypothetical protein
MREDAGRMEGMGRRREKMEGRYVGNIPVGVIIVLLYLSTYFKNTQARWTYVKQE